MGDSKISDPIINTPTRRSFHESGVLRRQAEMEMHAALAGLRVAASINPSLDIVAKEAEIRAKYEQKRQELEDAYDDYVRND